MNREEIAMLRDMWDNAKVNKGVVRADDKSLSNTCFITFGIYGMSVWKYRKNKWYRKIVNDWHNLSFVNFLKEYKSEEWEEI